MLSKNRFYPFGKF